MPNTQMMNFGVSSRDFGHIDFYTFLRICNNDLQ
jgi:hypothetical protein